MEGIEVLCFKLLLPGNFWVEPKAQPLDWATSRSLDPNPGEGNGGTNVIGAEGAIAASPCTAGGCEASLHRPEASFDRNPQQKQPDPAAHPPGVSLSGASEEKLWFPSLSKSSHPPLISLPLALLLSSISLSLLHTTYPFPRLINYTSPQLSSHSRH